MKNLNIYLAVSVCALSVQGAFGAITNLNAGESTDLFGITAAEDGTLPAFVVGDMTETFSISDAAGNLFEGGLQSRVLMRMDTGTIDFGWRIRDVENFAGQISSVVVTGFEGWSVGVEYRPDTLGDIGPDSAFRTEDGDSVGYNFDDPSLAFPNESHLFFARTEAEAFAMTGTVRITLVTGQFVELDTWVPAIPAPGSLALLGLGGMAAVRRRR